MQVLLIGSDQISIRWLEVQLSAIGFGTIQTASVSDALQSNAMANAGAILLDLSNHDAPGHDHVRKLREAGFGQPVLVLSSQVSWHDRVESLDAGADDYLTKPVRTEEVAARLRAVARRFVGCASNRTRSGDIEVELAAGQAWLSGEPLDLTRSEFRLLRLFMLQPDKVHSPQDLQSHIFVGTGECSANSLEVQIGRLRRKIGKERILTVRGMGYRMICSTENTDMRLECEIV